EAIAQRKASVALFAVAYFGVRAYSWYTSDSSHTFVNFLAQLWATVQLAINVAAIWIVPAVVLGVLAPFLRRPSAYPWLWAPLALAAAAGAVALVVSQQQPLLLLLVPVLLVAAL